MNKRERWETIKSEDPETAQFILEVSEVFGKLDNVEIIELRKNHDTESNTTGD